MRGRKILNDVRRLRCLLSISEAGRRLGGGSSCSYDSPLYIPSSNLQRSCSRVGDGDGGLAIHLTSSLRGASSNGNFFFSSSSSSSSVSLANFSLNSCPASSPLDHQFNSYYSLSSSSSSAPVPAYLRHLSSFQAFAASSPSTSSSASFATTTEERLRVDEDEDQQQQQQVGGHDDEKPRQGFGEVQTTRGNGKQQQDTIKEQSVVVEEVARSHSGPQQQQQNIDVNRKVATDSSGNEGEDLGSVVRDDKSRMPRGWKDLGWTREEVFDWPNAISMARLLSGPLLAWMVVHELWSPALVGLALAGVSDWLDGYVARRMNTDSVLGSYLDPVADKFLVGSVAVAMAYSGLLHPALVALIVARDGGLMVGAFVYRAYSLGWQWNDWREFFRISIGGAGRVEPLFISKVNTVLQLALVGMGLLEPALSLGDRYSVVPLLSWAVVGTTSLSGIAYIRVYMKNPESLAALRRVARAPSSSNKAA